MHTWLAHLWYEYVVYINDMDIWIRNSNTIYCSDLNHCVCKTSSGMNINLLFLKTISLSILFPQHNNIMYNDALVIFCIESSSYSIWCCKAYVIQKRSKGLSFGIGYEHFVSTVLVSLWSAVFYSYICLQKVLKL